MICREIITYWVHVGQMLDPHSHLSTVIPLAHLCEVVHCLGDWP